MNRGFATYFSGGLKAAVNTVYKSKGFLYYWLYTAMAFVGRLLLIFFPVFSLANVRQAKIAHANNKAVVAENFRVACKANSLWAYIGARLLEFLIFLGGMLLIGVATGLLALLGLLIGYVAPAVPTELLIVIFCIPGMLAVTVLSVMCFIIFAPTAYIVESNPGISAAVAVSVCLKSMRHRGKGTCFLNYFVPMLILNAIFGFLIGANVIVNLFLAGTVAGTIIAVILIFVTVAAFFLIFPIFNLTMKVANKSLFEDIALDPANAGKHTSGVNIKGCKGVLFAPETIEENLSMLFDETEEESVPLPTSNAQTQHDRSARMGATKVDLSEGEDIKYDTSDRQGRS